MAVVVAICYCAVKVAHWQISVSIEKKYVCLNESNCAWNTFTLCLSWFVDTDVFIMICWHRYIDTITQS